jgi:hypothetical protein
MTNIAGYGLRRGALLGYYDHNTLSLKMAQTSLIEDYKQSLDSLPASGIMQNGFIYQATSLISKREENDYMLLPTPTKHDSKCAVRSELYLGTLKKGVGMTLAHWLRDGPEDGKYPNPLLLEALMSFPILYTDLNASVMRLYP